MTQKGLPTRVNSVEGGNLVPIDVIGPGKSRPILRDDLIEGFYAWRPDGEEGLYAGYDTDGVPSMQLFDNTTSALTDITPATDANGDTLVADSPAVGECTVVFLAVKFAPFYVTGMQGYLCYILVRASSGGPFGDTTQIWMYNAGTADPTGSLPAGAVTTSYHTIGGALIETTPLFTLRDIAFSWGGTSGGAVDQIPYGVLVGDGPQIADPTTANVYCIGFETGAGAGNRLVPTPALWAVDNDLPLTGNSRITKIDAFRKSFAVLTFDDNTLVNQVFESVNTDALFVAEPGPPPLFGRLDTLDFTEIRAGAPNDLRRTTPTGAGDDDRPEYTDVAWKPNRNGLMVVGRHGRIITIENQKWIFETPTVDTSVYNVTTDVYPDSTTTHTGIHWSPDGIGYLLASKTFNSDPSVGTVAELEDVSDAFVRNLVTYYTPSVGYYTLTLNESRVSGFPFTALNEYGQEHYRYAWHPFSRFALFSVFGGFDKFDQDVFVDIEEDIDVTANVPEPLNIRIQDGDGVTLADVITDALGINRLAVDSVITGISTTPDDPLHVQDPQMMVESEINLATSSVAGTTTTGDVEDLFDWGTTTGVADAAGDMVVTVEFSRAYLISRVSMQKIDGGNGITAPYIEVRDVWGNWNVVLDYSMDPTEYDGIDTGNFKDQARYSSAGGPESPIMATAVRITNTTGAVAWSIGELQILKTIETKAYAYNEPREPLFVEAEQQIAWDEVDWEESDISALGASSFSTYTTDLLFDKDARGTPVSFTFVDGNGTIDVAIRHPKLIDRIAFVGPVGADGFVVQVTDVEGNTHTIDDVTGSVSGYDSGNFEPITALNVIITLRATADIFELTILKVIETKSFTETTSAELMTGYGQYVTWDPLQTNTDNPGSEVDRHYFLMRVPLEVDAGDDPAVDPDSTTDSFDTTEVDAQRLEVDFHVPHDDIRRARHIAQGMVTVENSDNCTLSSVRLTLGRRNIGDDTFTTIDTQSIGEVGGAGTPIITSGPGVRHVNYLLQGWVPEDIPEDEVLVLRVEVWGYQESSDATPSWVTLWHSRGSADIKAVLEIIRSSTREVV